MGPSRFAELTGELWRIYADRRYNSWKKTFLWDMIEPYRRPKTFTPLISIYVAAFYTGVIGAAITEQLYKFPVIIPWPSPQTSLGKNLWQFGEDLKGNKGLVMPSDTISQEKYWEEHSGEAVPLMKPKFYYGPWRVMRGEVPP